MAPRSASRRTVTASRLCSRILHYRQRIAGREPADFTTRIHGMDDPAVRPEYECCRLDVRLALVLAGVAADDARGSFGVQVEEHPELQPQLPDGSPGLLFA